MAIYLEQKTAGYINFTKKWKNKSLGQFFWPCLEVCKIVCLTDSDDASVGNDELNRMPKDGIILSVIILLLFCKILYFACIHYCLQNCNTLMC